MSDRSIHPAAFLCFAAFVAFAATTPASAGAVPADDLSPFVSVDEAARGLESPLFGQRQLASQRLTSAELKSVPTLLASAKDGNLEAAVRAVGILEMIYVSADNKGEPAAIDAVELALDDLTRCERASVAARAEEILELHYDIRERRAIAEVQRLEGRAVFKTTRDSHVPFNRLGAPIEQPSELSKGRGELDMVIIGPKWQGGDDGLKQVARLKRLRKLYRIEGSRVSEEGIARLRAELPGLDVQVRGAAKLGIESAANMLGPERGCLVGEIVEGEAAANAGLRTHDVILRFAGRSVDGFEALIALLRGYKPGDTVEASILRDDLPMTVHLTLTGWD